MFVHLKHSIPEMTTWSFTVSQERSDCVILVQVLQGLLSFGPQALLLQFDSSLSSQKILDTFGQTQAKTQSLLKKRAKVMTDFTDFVTRPFFSISTYFWFKQIITMPNSSFWITGTISSFELLLRSFISGLISLLNYCYQYHYPARFL